MLLRAHNQFLCGIKEIGLRGIIAAQSLKRRHGSYLQRTSGHIIARRVDVRPQLIINTFVMRRSDAAWMGIKGEEMS